MFTLKVQSVKGELLQLTNVESDYQVVSIDGLNPPQAIINSSSIVGMDGTKFKSSKLTERNIVITLKINGDVEKNRLKLYRYFKTKQWCKILYTNNSRDVYIEGYVESIDCDLFSNSQRMQISIICQNPYFKNAEEIVDDISKTIALFEFPFEIMFDDPIEFSTYEYAKVTDVVNDSETEVGLIIEIEFVGVTNDPKIINVITNDEFQVLGRYDIGDKIIINTNKGQKSVKLIRNAKETNLFDKLVFGSVWHQLEVGSNQFSYGADNGDAFMHVIYRHNNVYEGV